MRELINDYNTSKAWAELDLPTQVDTPAVAPVFTRDDIGCYADCSRGQYIGCVVIELAVLDHGFMPYGESLLDEFSAWSENEERFVSMYHSEWEDFLISREDYCELWDMAENFLNTLCDSDVYFGSSECGDWGLWEVEQEEDEDEDTDNE